MRRARWILTLVAALGVVACSDDPTGTAPRPVAGALIVRLTTPHADDGALVFAISGPSIASAVTADTALRLFTRQVNDSTLVAVVVGVVDSAGGSLVTLQVPDLGAAGRYTARVIEVADRQDILRASLAGYVLTVAP